MSGWVRWGSGGGCVTRGPYRAEHAPGESTLLDLILALAQPSHEGIGESAFFMAVGFQPIHSNGILGKVRHAAQQACRHSPMLASVPLNRLLWRHVTPVIPLAIRKKSVPLSCPALSCFAGELRV